jgi:hypothetical protein
MVEGRGPDFTEDE